MGIIVYFLYFLGNAGFISSTVGASCIQVSFGAAPELEAGLRTSQSGKHCETMKTFFPIRVQRVRLCGQLCIWEFPKIVDLLSYPESL